MNLRVVALVCLAGMAYYGWQEHDALVAADEQVRYLSLSPEERLLECMVRKTAKPAKLELAWAQAGVPQQNQNVSVQEVVSLTLDACGREPGVPDYFRTSSASRLEALPSLYIRQLQQDSEFQQDVALGRQMLKAEEDAHRALIVKAPDR